MKISRRRMLGSSAAALTFCCAPELLAQARNDGGIRINHVGEFLDELRVSRTYTMECARAMPETNINFAPVPTMRTYGQQLVHLAESIPGMFELFIEEKAKPIYTFSEAGKEEVRSKNDVIAQLGKGFDYVESAAAKVRNSDLRKMVKTFGGLEMSKHRVLRFILDHATHHRSQCVVYLRISGIRPPLYRA